LRALTAVVALFITFAAFGDDFDKKIESDLQKLNPSAVATWDRANALRAAAKHAEALALYAQVYQTTPQFVHALRRQAGEEYTLGRKEDALEHLRRAVAEDRSPQNLITLARILGEQNQFDEAKELGKEAAKLAPDDPNVAGNLAQIAMSSGDLELLTSATDRLLVIARKEPSTHAFAAYLAASKGEWSDAQDELDQAKTLGLPKETYARMQSSFNNAMPFYVRWWKPFAIAIASWIAAFGLLFVLGVLLSHVAMRAAREKPSSLGENVTTLSSSVRKLYAAVIAATSSFYYASIPIVIALVLLVCGGGIYAAFALGHIPIKLIVLLVVVGGSSIWAILKSIFVRRVDEEPGQRLDLAKQPRLRALLDDVAAKIGTRPVDNVYLTPATDLAVMQRGKHQRERCLILGIAALDGMKIRPFKAVLGHEYGHFVNRDTAGGSFALAVRRSLNATAFSLARSGVATWYNPAWHFVRGFNLVFLRISQGASRLQEVLADRWAVFAYGADAFEAGLRHVIDRSVRFDAHATATLNEVVKQKLPLANLYTYQPATNAPSDAIEKKIAESLERAASVYDSHPSPSERFTLVHALPPHARESARDDDSDAWTLFDHAEELQLAMTTQVRANVAANYGIAIRATASA
jgi:Zn-dependent protease with chaperone function